jgi:acyl-CoA reductase-like NAD-dependent aldehyde dehydrogenase
MPDVLRLDPWQAARPSPEFLRTSKQLLIGGEWAPARSGQTIATVDPATEQVLTRVAAAGDADVDLAVAAARRAFEDPSWSAAQPSERGRALLSAADAIERHREELAVLEALDLGCPIAAARAMVAMSADVFRHYAGWPTKLYGQTAPSGPSQLHCVLRRPVGVCAAITAWNAPLYFATWKLAPALACGNTVVLKPAEQAPLTSLRLGELLQEETPLPPGVVNILTGTGDSAGEALVRHRGVDKVAFTGSGPVGRRILAVCADRMARVTLELGGKSPFVVFADADLKAAAATAASAFCVNSGQTCVAGSRVFVQDAAYEEFGQLLTEELAAYSLGLGDPFHPATRMGPLVSREHFDRVAGYLRVAREDGGVMRTGGETAGGPGFFVPPTLVEGVTGRARIARAEVFGPVATLMPFTDLDDAVRQGNDTEYGLAASVFTRDLTRAHQTADRLRAGTVWINSWGDISLSVPFGGVRQSGIGRENGISALEAYTEPKAVLVNF